MKKGKERILALTTAIIFTFSIFGCFVSREAWASAANPPPWKPWNVFGEQKLVVICTEFSDVPHSVESITIGNRLGNMTKYFNDISLGKINITYTFYGDHWEQMNNTMAYYGNDSDSQEDAKGWEFITDSVKAWESYVNFSNYDYLLVIHAGNDQSSNVNDSELLWRKNFCSFGQTAKRSVIGKGTVYEFWGLAYDSEFEEWGLISHEMGHGFGLPDLYIENIENETFPMDRLSLMARGDRNGVPEGTLPASLEGFSMYLLGWLHPEKASLNSTEDILKMTPLGYKTSTLIRIPLTESTFYLLEGREKTGYDEDAVNSTSLIVWLIDEMKPSGNGTAFVCSNGIVNEGAIYSDAPAGIYIKFLSFNSTNHSAYVGLATKMFFVDIDFPESVQAYISTAKGKISVYDSSDNPAPYISLNVSVGNKQFQLITDSSGAADIDLGSLDLGSHKIEVSSPYLLSGDLHKMIDVIFPWDTVILVVISIILLVALLICVIKNRS